MVAVGFSWASKLDALTRASTSDPEGFLAHPVNAYKLMKRLNTEWSALESLVLQDPSDGKVPPPCLGGRQMFTWKPAGLLMLSFSLHPFSCHSCFLLQTLYLAGMNVSIMSVLLQTLYLASMYVSTMSVLLCYSCLF